MTPIATWARRQDYTAIDTIATGLGIATFAAWHAVFGDRTIAVVAGVAAYWTLHAAVAKRKLHRVETEFAAFRRNVGCDDT